MVITAGAEAASSTGAHMVDPNTLDSLCTSQNDLDRLAEALSKKMADLHALQDRFESAVKKQDKMLNAVIATHKSAKKANANARRTNTNSSNDNNNNNNNNNDSSSKSDSSRPPPAPSSSPNGPSPAANGSTDAQVEDRIASLSARLRERQQLMPSTGGMFVELFLGSINVRFQRKSERLAFKREYEGLKQKLAPLFVFFCLLCIALYDYRWVHMILQLALSCYYVALAIRENILRVNGSNIRPWWIIHHYLTMMQGVVLLTWPTGASYAAYRARLHAFGLYNAVLMIFQTRYQMARLYTLRSLGRASEMDVASSDSTQIHWSETMTLLLPLIVLGQIMQGYQATFLFRLYKRHPADVQIILLALLFTANFLGNTSTTLQVLLAKRAANGTKATRRPRPRRSASSASMTTADSDSPEPESDLTKAHDKNA